MEKGRQVLEHGVRRSLKPVNDVVSFQHQLCPPARYGPKETDVHKRDDQKRAMEKAASQARIAMPASDPWWISRTEERMQLP
jgi:hypothetical protein